MSNITVSQSPYTRLPQNLFEYTTTFLSVEDVYSLTLSCTSAASGHEARKVEYFRDVTRDVTKLFNKCLLVRQYATKREIEFLSKKPLRHMDSQNISEALKYLPGLRQLILDHTQVTDVAPLSTLTKLQKLDLSATQVADVAPLSTLRALQMLILDHTQVTDVAPLSTLTELQVLILSYTRVADVAALSTLRALQVLNLCHTRVADVAPLSTLTELQVLKLRDTRVADVAPLAHLTTLRIFGP